MNRAVVRQMSRKSTGRRGFTLLEMMMVVMVLGVLLTGSVWGVLPMLRRAWRDEALATLGVRLQQARSRAMATNQSVELTLSEEEKTLTVWEDLDEDEERDDGEVEVVTLSDRRAVTLESSWSEALYNAYGQFLLMPGSRSLSTQTTVFRVGGEAESTLRIHGSGAVEIP